MESLDKATCTSGVLSRKVQDFALSWRSTSFIARLPFIQVQSTKSGLEGFANVRTPDSSIVHFITQSMIGLSRKVPQLVEDSALRMRLQEALASMVDEFGDNLGKIALDLPADVIWKDFLHQEEFNMTIWASQRVAYVSYYNAYEAFLIDCLKYALAADSLRTWNPEFKEALRSMFGINLHDICWNAKPIEIARLVRHALSHAGGRETVDLAKQKHGVSIIEGIIQIASDDNKRMLNALMAGVDAFLDAAVKHPHLWKERA